MTLTDEIHVNPMLSALNYLVKSDYNPTWKCTQKEEKNCLRIIEQPILYFLLEWLCIFFRYMFCVSSCAIQFLLVNKKNFSLLVNVSHIDRTKLNLYVFFNFLLFCFTSIFFAKFLDIHHLSDDTIKFNTEQYSRRFIWIPKCLNWRALNFYVTTWVICGAQLSGVFLSV